MATKRCPLARDAKGVAFDLPAEAYAWVVQRSTLRQGKQRTLYRGGVPLEVEIAADTQRLLERLEEAGDDGAGRYRLQAVDRDGRACCDTVAVVDFADEEGAKEDEASAPAPSGFGGELQQILAAYKDTLTEFRKRDEELHRTYRDMMQDLSQSLATVSQALIRGYAPVQPVTEAPIADDPDEAESERAPSLMQQLAEVKQHLPELLQLVQVLKSAMANGVNGHGGANGTTPPAGEGSAAS